jgi:hypothetical protein
MRPEIGIVDEDGGEHGRTIIPDVMVLRRPKNPGGGVASGSATATLDSPRAAYSTWVEFDRLGDEPAQHYFVEIRDASRGHKLVTLIEILSPSNKRPGPDRDAYEAKQREVLASDVSLIEIDLLRSGRRILANPHLIKCADRLEPRPDYLVLVSRAWERDNLSLGYIAFPCGVREILPCIPVPLKEGEAEVPLDLQYAFASAYEGGPYRLGAVDYGVPPSPPLPTPDAEWAETRLRA